MFDTITHALLLLVVVQETEIIVVLSICMFSFGYFPGVRLSFADVSEPSVRSIFKGWMKNMISERRAWYLYIPCQG
jgi:hypothetical protein